MRVLVVGGSGYVAGLVLPVLARHHDVRILDPRPPARPYPHISGDATDQDTLRAAVSGTDAVLHCAMGALGPRSLAGIGSLFDVHVKSAYLTLTAAHRAGVLHAVYVSSLSVYRELTRRRVDEGVPPDAVDPYGLTKRLGEEACRAVAEQTGMSVNVLRLTWPTPDEYWPLWAPPWLDEPRLWRTPEGTPIHATAGSDLARAVLAALAHRDGYQSFTISGDDSARLWSIDKARQVLGWSPTFPRG
jgi:nucleoside-diphosphate-sugar epimerase